MGTNFGTGGFPKYDVLADGYPANFNIDGKMLVGFGASADRYERWLTRPLPGPDGLGAWDKAAGMFVRGQGVKSGNAPMVVQTRRYRPTRPTRRSTVASSVPWRTSTSFSAQWKASARELLTEAGLAARFARCPLQPGRCVTVS